MILKKYKGFIFDAAIHLTALILSVLNLINGFFFSQSSINGLVKGYIYAGVVIIVTIFYWLPRIKYCFSLVFDIWEAQSNTTIVKFKATHGVDTPTFFNTEYSTIEFDDEYFKKKFLMLEGTFYGEIYPGDMVKITYYRRSRMITGLEIIERGEPNIKKRRVIKGTYVRLKGDIGFEGVDLTKRKNNTKSKKKR